MQPEVVTNKRTTRPDATFGSTGFRKPMAGQRRNKKDRNKFIPLSDRTYFGGTGDLEYGNWQGKTVRDRWHMLRLNRSCTLFII